MSKLAKSDSRKVALASGSALALVLVMAVTNRETAEGVIRLAFIGLAAGAGCVAGWFFTPAAAGMRRAVAVAAAALAGLAVIKSGSMFGNVLTSFLVPVAFVGGLTWMIGRLARDFFRKPTTFGSAEWATPEYLRDADLLGDGGLRIGTVVSDEGDMRLRYNRDRHLLTIAPNRSGKGTTAIIPNLLSYTGSALVIDPKGENALITAAARQRMGHAVHVVDPWQIASTATGETARFNPLDWLARGDIDMADNAMLLADALVVTDGGNDRFWAEEAKALLHGLILYVCTDDREADERHLGRVRDLLLCDGDEMKALFSRMAESPHHLVASTGARCLQKEEKLLANVIASAQAETHFLDSPRIRESMAVSDFKFEDLKTDQMTVYLVLPSDRLSAFGRWLRLLIQQAITVNARNIDVQPPQPVLFLLDELPALGRLAMVEQAYGLMAGFGIQLWGIVQDVSQLKRIYGDGWETFVSNAGAIQYFGSRDSLTAEYFSSLCGVTTVWSLSNAISRAYGGNGGGSSTDTQSASQRKLAFPDELMRLPSHLSLVLIENHHPVMARKVKWFEDATLRTLGRNLRLT